MKTFNLLFLGGSQRVAVGKMFLKAAAARGLEPHITGYELDPLCPLASVGTVLTGLKWNDPDIYDDLLRIVQDRNIDAIIPFVDSAVFVAAEFARRYGPDIFVPGSPAPAGERMFDKIAAAEFFEARGIPVPRTYRPGDPCLRLIAKPRFGSASQGIVSISSLEQLYSFQGQTGRYLIQERIDNRQEISVDCYASVADGTILVASPRLRLRVTGGEVTLTRTVDDAEAADLASRVIKAAGLRGAVTVQLIRDLDDGRLMVMEVNPRLGGGVVATVNAGADIPGLIVDEALGHTVEPVKARPGVTTARYLADTVFYPDAD